MTVGTSAVAGEIEGTERTAYGEGTGEDSSVSKVRSTIGGGVSVRSEILRERWSGINMGTTPRDQRAKGGTSKEIIMDVVSIM